MTGQTCSIHNHSIKANITATTRNGDMFWKITDWNFVKKPDHTLLSNMHIGHTTSNFIERLWAYLSVKVCIIFLFKSISCNNVLLVNFINFPI